MPRSGIPGSYGNSSQFLEEPLYVLHNDCTNLHSYQQCRRIPFSAHSLHHLFVDFYMLVMTITNCEVLLIVVLICISLITSEVEHFFMCLFSSCMSSLEKCLFRSSVHFFDWVVLFFPCWVVWARCIFWKLTLVGHTICRYFLPVCRLSFRFVDGFLCCTKTCKFD